MRLTGKTAFLVFLFFLISPLYMESLYGEDPPLNGDNFFFFEEFFIFEEMFSFDESLLIQETFPGEEIFSGGENFLSDDNFLYDEAFFFEAPAMIFEVPVFQIRSLDEIFPNLSPMERMTAMSNRGIRHSFMRNESPDLVPNPQFGINLLTSVISKNPSHIIEALVVLPYNRRELDLLDIYNALGRIEKIKDHSVPLNGRDFYVFTESTRIESARNRRAVSDPQPATFLPFSETMYLRLREVNLGNLFIRGDISISMYGITYSMTNFTDVRYFLVPIVRTERYITIIYLEPVREGILIYSMTGFYIPGFIADRVNLTPNINRRIQIFINWITDGLRVQENTAAR